jgi:hypothetical protein
MEPILIIVVAILLAVALVGPQAESHRVLYVPIEFVEPKRGGGGCVVILILALIAVLLAAHV